MKTLSQYQPTPDSVWKGRIDDLHDHDAWRWHQLVERIDLRDSALHPLREGQSGFCLLGYCCDKGVVKNLGRPGAAKGPRNIRQELANLPRSFDHSIRIFDAGNITCERNSMENSQEQLAIAIGKILDMQLIPIVLGGSHDVALGHYTGILDFNKDQAVQTGIINLDAHFDLRPYGDGGNSGTMFLQIADLCRNRGRDFPYLCIGIQKTANTVQLLKKADELRAQYILEKDIYESALPQIKEKINAFIDKQDQLYLTLCSDVFSAAYAPGVSATQPFGMHPEMVLTLLKYIISSGKVISFDIAEVAPRFDEDNRTAKLAAITIFAVINTMIERKNEK